MRTVRREEGGLLGFVQKGSGVLVNRIVIVLSILSGGISSH
jgi:hypothetical protein